MLDLIVKLNTTDGKDFQFRSSVVDSSAVSVGGSFTTPMLRTVDYKVISTQFIPAGNTGVIAATAEAIEL